MSPAAKEPDQSTYSGRFAARLRMLREKAGLTGEQAVKAICDSGYRVGKTAYYNWESGKHEPPLNAFPAIASVMGTKPRTLLPPE